MLTSRPYRSARRAGFTLLEVMLAVAIMSISLAAVFSAQGGSIKMAQRARKLSLATLLARCKMGEIEEDLLKLGLPATEKKESDECCKDAPIDGFHCDWEVVPIILPDTMFRGDEDEEGDGTGKGPGNGKGAGDKAGGSLGQSSSSDGKSGGLTGLLGAASSALGVGNDSESGENSKDGKDKDGKDKDDKDKDGKDKQDPQDLLSGDPSRFLSGGGEVDAISAMAMQYVYPILKPSFQSQIRRVSVTVEWSEGSADKTFDLSQYVVAEQPVPLALDPNDPNGLGTGTGTGTGTGSSQNTMGTGIAK